MEAAAKSGDVASILRLMTSSSRLTSQDYIKGTLGALRYAYYAFVDRFHIQPFDLIDMVDGILYIEAANYQEKEVIDNIKANAKAPKK